MSLFVLFPENTFQNKQKNKCKTQKNQKHIIRQMSLSSAIRAPPSLKGIMCRIFTKYYTNLAEWNVLHIIATVSVSLAAVPIIFRLCV